MVFHTLIVPSPLATIPDNLFLEIGASQRAVKSLAG